MWHDKKDWILRTFCVKAMSKKKCTKWNQHWYLNLFSLILKIMKTCLVFADPPSSTAGRTLTLVAKSVQNLANLVEFGAKVFGFSRCVRKWVTLNRRQRVLWMLMSRCICRDVFVLQEPYMEGVNPFIKNNKQRMIMFLDELGVNCPVSIFKAAWVACGSVYELCVK